MADKQEIGPLKATVRETVLEKATLPPSPDFPHEMGETEMADAIESVYLRFANRYPNGAGPLLRRLGRIAAELEPRDPDRTVDIKAAMELTGLSRSLLLQLPRRKNIGKVVDKRLKFTLGELDSYMNNKRKGRPPGDAGGNTPVNL